MSDYCTGCGLTRDQLEADPEACDYFENDLPVGTDELEAKCLWCRDFDQQHIDRYRAMPTGELVEIQWRGRPREQVTAAELADDLERRARERRQRWGTE